MGNVYDVKCPQCEYSARLYLGGGLNSIKLPYLLKHLNDEGRGKLKMLNEYGLRYATGSNLLVRRCCCSEGAPIYEAFTVNATDKDGTAHTLGLICDKCGRALEVLDIKKSVLCPLCNKADLEVKIAGHWD